MSLISKEKRLCVFLILSEYESNLLQMILFPKWLSLLSKCREIHRVMYFFSLPNFLSMGLWSIISAFLKSWLQPWLMLKVHSISKFVCFLSDQSTLWGQHRASVLICESRQWQSWSIMCSKLRECLYVSLTKHPLTVISIN